MVFGGQRDGIIALSAQFYSQVFRLHVVVSVILFSALIGNNARKRPLLGHEFDVQDGILLHVERISLISVQTVVLHRKRRFRLIGNTHRRTIMSRRTDTTERAKRHERNQKHQSDLFHAKTSSQNSFSDVFFSAAAFLLYLTLLVLSI